jgi:hypothetical protein
MKDLDPHLLKVLVVTLVEKKKGYPGDYFEVIV